MVTVLVTGAGGGVGQGVIKSLRLIPDLPLRIIGADMSAKAAGLYACDAAHLVERSDAPGYLDSLARIFAAEDVDYYLPGTDVELSLCAARKAEIKDRFGVTVVVNPASVVRIADDKAETAAFLASEGLPHPATMTLAQARATPDLRFPVIVKPAIGFRSIGVERAESHDDLLRYPGPPDGIIVQELVGDDSTEYTCTIVGHGGTLSPVLALRRDLRSGDTYRAYPERHPQIDAYVADVAARLGIDGSCNFQLRLDRDGVPKLFEINARFSGTTPLCAQLGFNPVEFYLKRDLGLAYEPRIAWDRAILRFWSEAVLPLEALSELERAGTLTPDPAPQFNLFGRRT
ncbi:ATP-grasp domain-containing protein [Jannaschia ovalis]|uniref:ATP-grasp domain-containing protein n=1 Tax=Jannaschia ovalis TaxID=3038773 RepID=A0ABY8LEI3_9RHOB|nr:ATP-grasp domain-containing protein [Jannaschia sp. GRR-S6-38]WGH78720.1 ATP-grasp domain-containing protein [Jannaschia sp. GRR-S6-38]